MIKYEKEYVLFLKKNGVGSNDKVASSVKSYISYLNSVSKYLNITIGPETVRTIDDINNLSSQLIGKVASKTIKNYGSAMKQYVQMVAEKKL